MTATIFSFQASLLNAIKRHMQLFPIAHLSNFRGSTSLYVSISAVPSAEDQTACLFMLSVSSYGLINLTFGVKTH